MINWPVGKFLKPIIFLQVAFIVSVGLGMVGFDIPFLRQVLGFLYLSLLPGLLILRLLKVRHLGAVTTLLYVVGLSIAFTMFLGLFTNTLHNVFGLSKPISLVPLVTTFGSAIGILTAAVYAREKRDVPTSDGRKTVLSIADGCAILWLLLLPVLGISGALLLNFNENNTIALSTVLLIAVTVCLLAADKFIPRKLYPLAIWTVALTLLLQGSLRSQYLVGWDIHLEYYQQNQVLTNAFWNLSVPDSINAMLSITMLAPVYSLLLQMDSIYIFKIIYPLFFSLVPLALFQQFSSQMDEKIALAACFFFVAFAPFFSELLQLTRQQIAELFFVLSVLVMIDKRMPAFPKMIILLCFGMSLVVSHYGVSYFYVLYLALALIILYLMDHATAMVKMWSRIVRRPRGNSNRNSSAGNPVGQRNAPKGIPMNLGYVVLVIVFCLAWYLYVSSSAPFSAMVKIGDTIYSNINSMLTGEGRESSVLIAVGLKAPAINTWTRHAYLMFQYVTELLIIIGLGEAITRWRNSRLNPITFSMALTSAILLGMSIILPFFASSFAMTRVYHLALLFLAPFCISGGVLVLKSLVRLARLVGLRAVPAHSYLSLVMLLVVVPYFLFNSGFMYVIQGEDNNSYALDPTIDYQIYSPQEVAGMTWSMSNRDPSTVIMGDMLGMLRTLEYGQDIGVGTFWGDTTEIPDDSLIYLRAHNISPGSTFKSLEKRAIYVSIQTSPFGMNVLNHANEVYDNGSSAVFHK